MLLTYSCRKFFDTRLYSWKIILQQWSIDCLIRPAGPRRIPSLNCLYFTGSRYCSSQSDAKIEVKKYDKYYKARKFVDWTYSRIKAGDGGCGSGHIRKTRKLNFGGPDGGDGGRGGDVIIKVEPGYKHLKHIKPHYFASNGTRGMRSDKYGKSGASVVIGVPVGTVVKERGSLTPLANLMSEGQQFVAARGGEGGLGNLHFKSASNQLPREYTPGEEGESKIIEFELKTIADVGLVGFPNAGKSTLLRALSRATPAVASYPFTTLRPYIGAVEYADLSQIFVADIPGLVQNAHLNRGLGHSFLRHIERCKCLIFVLDLSVQNPIAHLNSLKNELRLYKEGLDELPSIILGNKIDMVKSYERVIRDLEIASKKRVIAVSGKLKINIDHLKKILHELCSELGIDKNQQQSSDKVDSQLFSRA